MDFELDYKRLRFMVLRGEIGSEEAKLWLKSVSLKRIDAAQERLKRFGTNVNRENKDLSFLSETSDE